MHADDRVRLRHMVDAAESIAAFIEGRQRDDLDTNRMLLFAVVRAIEIIGEAAGKVSEETCARSPAIPWRAIIGMRNRLIHGYFDVDADVVWRTVTQEIPSLMPELRKLLAQD